MTDDLVKRLRSSKNVFYEYAADDGAFLREAADRIEELEAKLAKLIEASKPFAAIKIKDGRSQPGEIGRTDVTNIRAALAELTGGEDD